MQVQILSSAPYIRQTKRRLGLLFFSYNILCKHKNRVLNKVIKGERYIQDINEFLTVSEDDDTALELVEKKEESSEEEDV